MPVDVVERFINAGRIKFKRDLFSIIDLIVLGPKGVIGVQVCGADYSSHWKKITIEKAAETRRWLDCPGCTLEIWSWRLLKLKRGGKAKRWRARVEIVTHFDLEPEKGTRKNDD
jgi:hypothetical protein